MSTSFVTEEDWGEPTGDVGQDILDSISILRDLGINITQSRFFEVFFTSEQEPRRVDEYFALEAAVLRYIHDQDRDPALLEDCLLSDNGHLTLPNQRIRQEKNKVRRRKEKKRERMWSQARRS